ncbi:hypothetical protein AB0J72_09290 [Dactylosporangium sp. NPDC049742]|uniref:hypothetical protein n=1 Tax=Dactylosporangium sp. NPDC049742 TaxID=3154737 RepID=UPI0034123A3B
MTDPSPAASAGSFVDGARREWVRRAGWVALAVAVVATATVVPPLVLPDGRGHPPAATASTPPPGGPSPAPVPPTPTLTAPAPATPLSALPRTSAPAPGASPSRTPAGSSTFAAISLHAADAANLRNGARVIECPTCVGGSRVGYIGGPNTLAIRVTGVAAAGERTMTVTYETAETRTLRVAVNDGPTQSLTLSGAGDWRIPATVTLRVHLPAGTSWIRFFNDEGPAPDVNQIQLH